MRLAPAIVGFLFLFPASLFAAETYETFFRDGALAGMETGETLTYDMKTTGWSAPRGPAAAEHKNREGVLSLSIDAEDSAVLRLARASRDQEIGVFPASVGNPVIMFFLESTLRDMAGQAGGSPFYIRNRIKDSLLRKADRETVKVAFEDKEIVAQRAIIRPFAADPARDRMGGFADLSIAVTVSEDIPGWYYSLVASAPATGGVDKDGYRQSITLKTQQGDVR